MKISVILCTYNRCQSLAKALDSAARLELAQSDDCEILVVDNNSSDQTRAIAEAYCLQYPRRFRYLFESRQGKSHALNTGIRVSTGEIIAFMDDDVVVDRSWLQNLTGALRGNDWAGAGGRIVPQQPFSPPSWLPIHERYGLAPLAMFDLGGEAGPLDEPPFGTNMAFKRRVFEQYGDFRTELGPPPSKLRGEDTEFGYRLLKGGERLRYEPSAIVYHAVPNQRLQKQYFLQWWYDHGRGAIRDEELPLTTRWSIAGIPFFVFRRLVIWILRWQITIDTRRRFGSRLRVQSTLGSIDEYFHLSRESIRSREQSTAPRETHTSGKYESAKAAKLHDIFANDDPHQDLMGKALRGSIVALVSNAAQFFVNMISIIILARLLSPRDFGLVGMVTVATGFLAVAKDSGLSWATIQRESISHPLISTVFWINAVLGLAIVVVSAILAPYLVAFFHEPDLYWITIAIAATLLIEALGAQHSALLRRHFRLKAVAAIEMSAMIISVGIAVAMAYEGFGYWALVAMRAAFMLTNTLAVWIVEPWRPGPPLRGTGAGSMMRFGGYLTGVELLTYSTRNLDNVLIGWAWGPAKLGLYQKAYSLLMLPINQIHTPIGSVAVSALSRVQSDPERLRHYFIVAYSIVTSIILPIIIAVTIFADDIIVFILGEQWIESARIFRLLAPAALVAALLNPFAWLFISSGNTQRQLIISLVWSPLIVLSFFLGLAYGPEGVAIAFSAMSALLAIPVCIYAVRGTAIRIADIALAIKYPMIAGAAAGLAGILLELNVPANMPVAVHAIGGCFVIACTFAFVLLIALRQWAPYRDVLRSAFPAPDSEAHRQS